MAFTITAANKTNRVLDNLVELVKMSGVKPHEELVEASVVLAGEANKVLHAGWTPEKIREALT